MLNCFNYEQTLIIISIILKKQFFNEKWGFKGENPVYVIYERSLSGPHKYVGDFLSFVFIFAAAPQRRYTGLFVLPRKEVKCGFWFENAQHIYYFDVILKIESILGLNFRLSF